MSLKWYLSQDLKEMKNKLVGYLRVKMVMVEVRDLLASGDRTWGI